MESCRHILPCYIHSLPCSHKTQKLLILLPFDKNLLGVLFIYLFILLFGLLLFFTEICLNHAPFSLLASWSYLAKLLVLHIKLSLFYVGVHAHTRKQSRATLVLHEDQLPLELDAEEPLLTEVAVVVVFFSPTMPTPTSPFSHFRPEAVEAHQM